MTIGEFSAVTGIVESTLRYYEKKGIIRIARDNNNNRNYSEADITWVQFIQKLKDTGMQLKDIQKYSDLRHEGDSTMPERLEMLKVHKKYVEEQCARWERYAKNLDDKIDYYKENIIKLGILEK